MLLILYVEEFIVTVMMLLWRRFATPPTATSRNDVWPERRNSMLMARHYQDLGTDSDWSCCVWNLLQQIRSTTQIWVVRRHQCGISALVSQTSFHGKPLVESRNVVCFYSDEWWTYFKFERYLWNHKKSLSFVVPIILAMQHIMNKYTSRDSMQNKEHCVGSVSYYWSYIFAVLVGFVRYF